MADDLRSTPDYRYIDRGTSWKIPTARGVLCELADCYAEAVGPRCDGLIACGFHGGSTNSATHPADNDRAQRRAARSPSTGIAGSAATTLGELGLGPKSGAGTLWVRLRQKGERQDP